MNLSYPAVETSVFLGVCFVFSTLLCWQQRSGKDALSKMAFWLSITFGVAFVGYVLLVFAATAIFDGWTVG